MRISQLQGTPWHYENRKNTCKEGSTYCLYNHNICSCKASIHYHKKCVGKGECDDFESRGRTAKILEEKNYNSKEIEKEMTEQEINNEETKESKETKEEKFLRVSKERIHKVEAAINNLENLSKKSSYGYTDEQVDKMFNYLSERLERAKSKFKSGNTGDFSW